MVLRGISLDSAALLIALCFAPACRTERLPSSNESQTGGPLVGVVKDIAGGPISGATVHATRFGPVAGLDEVVARTEIDGAFQLRLEDWSYTIVITHPGFAPRSLQVGRKRPARDMLEVRLEKAASIFGTVLDRTTGGPVPGAEVAAVGECHIGPGGDVPRSSAFADTTGAFTLGDLPAGTVQLRASLGDLRSWQPELVPLRVAQKATEVHVWVERGGEVSGVAVARDNPYRPLAKVWIAARDPQTGYVVTSSTPSDTEGHFSIRGLPPAVYVLDARHEAVPWADTGTSVIVDTRDATAVQVPVDATVSLSGRVDPPVRASLRLERLIPADVYADQLSVEISTDGAGQFQFPNVPPGRFAIVADSDGGQHGEIQLAVADQDIAQLAIHLKAGCTLAGVVVNEGGHPGLDSWVAISNAVADPDYVHRLSNQRTRSDSPFEFRAAEHVFRYLPTGAQGNFLAAGLPPGPYDVAVYTNTERALWATTSYTGRPDMPITIPVSENGPAKVRLVIADCDGRISGIATDAAGRSLPNALVAIAKGSSDVSTWTGGLSAFTDESGHFAVPGLCRDTSYRILAYDQDRYSRGEIRNVHVGDSIELRLADPQLLTASVSYGGAEVVDYAYALLGSVRRQARVRDGAGRVTVPLLDPGPYVFSVQAEEGYQLRTIDLLPDKSHDIHVHLVPWSALRGQLAPTVAQALHDADVFVAFNALDVNGRTDEAPPIGMRMYRTATDADGRFVVTHIPAGTARIVFQRGMRGFNIATVENRLPAIIGIQSDSLTVKVSPGETIDLGRIEVDAR